MKDRTISITILSRLSIIVIVSLSSIAEGFVVDFQSQKSFLGACRKSGYRQNEVVFSSINGDGDYDPSGKSSNGAESLSESNIALAANELAKNDNDVVDLPDEISSSFMQYALSIIMGRALPDARDGLKPVHRRILYAMSGLNLNPGGGYRKCARVVGEVLGKYHPHGDTAVYDALVRLAQPFSTNMPLISGHGNFGSIDADPAAAMRYTECRLSAVSAEALLDEISEDTVNFIPNFDGNEVEPVVLPAKLPVLLMNGCAGIAVGMATNVPPHNLNELMDAAIALTKGDVQSDEDLFKLVPAPDFPTGATIIGTEGVQRLYTTGNGPVLIRSVTHTEEIKTTAGRKARTAIIVTQLPYQVNKAALIEKIAQLVNDKKIDGVADLRDESDRDGIRIVIELKRDAQPNVVLNNLYKKTPLQTTFSGNFLALMGEHNKPQRFTLRTALECFLDFRFQTIRRKVRYQLGKVQKRLEVVEGLLVALENVDQVIDVIRSSPNQNAAKEILTSTDHPKSLNLTTKQADAVLKLQLGQLTRLNKDKLTDEQSNLLKSMKRLQKLLAEDDAVKKVMIKEFQETKKKFGTPRQTKILMNEDGDLDDIDLVENSRSVIVVTQDNYIKRMPLVTFANQKRGTRGKKGTSAKKTKEENQVAHSLTCNDHDTLLITTMRGVAFGLPAFKVPEGGRTGKGTAIPSVLPFKADDVISSLLPVSEFSDEEYCVLATENGWIKKTPLAAFENLTSRGLIIATLESGDKLKWCERCTDDDDILIGSHKGMATRFQAQDLRPTGRSSRGVRSMKLRDGDKVTDMSIVRKTPQKQDQCVLAVTNNGYGKRMKLTEFNTRKRSGVGVIAIKFKDTSEDDAVNCLRIVDEHDEALLVTSQGIIVRQKVSDIPIQGRAATGVRVQKVDTDGGDVISSVSIVPKYDGDNHDQ